MQHLRDAVQHGGDRERLVTDQVLASFDETPDPRTREILQALVTHLHALRPRRPAHRAGVDAGDRVPDPRRAHHRRPPPGVHPALRRPRALDADRRDQRAGRPGGDRVDRLRPVLRRGLARDPDRRRHRRGRQGRALLGRGPRHRHRRARRSRAPGSRSGRPTTTASTTSSRARRCPAARTSSPTTTAATASGRSSPRPTPSPTTARSATSSRRRNAARTARRTSISWSATRAIETLVTHVFLAGSEHLDDDAVFGVKESLIAPAEQQPPGDGPGRPHPGCALVAHDLRPPTGVSMSEHLTTDVLVIGSGPAGASAALFLATQGVDHIVITKYRWTANTPRAHITNQRTVEIMRDLGIEDDILANGTPQRLMGDTVFCTSLAGDEIGRVRTWGTHPAAPGRLHAGQPDRALRPAADAVRADPDRPRRRPRLAGSASTPSTSA